MKHTFTILGNPIPLARARINSKAVLTGNRKYMWDPQKELKLITALTLKNQFENYPLFSGPIKIEAIFYMPLPKSKSKQAQQDLVGTHHKSKPDIDNLLKFICDASHGVLYDDDCIVAAVDIKKIYDNIPRTVFTLENLL